MFGHDAGILAVYAKRIGALHLTPDEYASALQDPFLGERLVADGVELLVIEDPTAALELPDGPSKLPVVVAYLSDASANLGLDHVDLVVDHEQVGRLITTTAANPSAATSLVVLLRSIMRLPVTDALAAESAVYSMLQGSAEFRTWRQGTIPTAFDEDEPVVDVERHEDELVITLDRPHRHNAVTRQLRDELCAALRLAVIDDSIRSVLLSGRGPSFCSGGDLAEFGIRPDPSLAHRVRLAQSPAALIHLLRERTSARIHGATLGGGIEMAAFAGKVIADPATRIGLPEVELGLIPGAGGTVSLTHRIGRHRVATLALAVDTIDAETAHEWGLIDEIADAG